MPLVRSVDGVRIHYEVHDYTDPWVRSPVVLLQHGFGRTAAYWYAMIPHLARHYRVVCPTLRGFGQSEADFDSERGLSLEACLADLDAVIGDLDEPAVHFVGESMGGILGMAMAAHHPHRLRTLSLMTAPLLIPPAVQQTFAFGHGSWADALKNEGVYEWAKKANSATRFPPGTDAELVDWYARETGKNRLDAMLALVKLASTADVSGLLDRIRLPVLGLYPTAGAVATDSQLETLQQGIQNIQIVRLPTSFHMVWVLYPGACARHVLHFVAGHDGRACVE